MFYMSSYTKGWMSFIKRSDAAPVCYSKPLDSVKNWNDHFFWIDSTDFPLSVSLKSKILSKDPPPKLSQYDAEACDFLRTHTALFRKDGFFAFIRHSDPTKVRIRERNLTEREVGLLKITDWSPCCLWISITAALGDSDDLSIDKLFDEGMIAGCFRVVAGETKKKRKRKVTGDASGFTHPPKKLRDDYQSLPLNISRKSLTALYGMISKGFGILSGVTEPLLAASVAPMPDVGPVDSVSRLNLRTCPPHVRYVVSSYHHSGSYSEATSFVRSLAADAPVVTVAVTTTVVADVTDILRSKARDESKNLENIGDSASVGEANLDAVSISKLNQPSTSSDSFYASQSLDTKTMHRVYVPRWKVTNDSILDDLYVYRDLTDRLAPPALFLQLHAIDYDQLYSEFNVGAARQVCLGAEVRMRAEHTLEKKGELEDKCTEQAILLSERNAEIAHLKSLLSLKEVEAAEAIRLHGQLTTVEAADAVKDSELKDLKEKNFALKGERDVMSEKIATLESANVAKETELESLSSQVAKLTSDLSGFQLSRDELNSKVVSLESERDCLITYVSAESAFELFRERIEALQDEQAKALRDRIAELDAQLLKMAIHLDEEFYPRFLTAISGWRWLLSHGLKLDILKCLQSSEYLQDLGQAIGCVVNKDIQDGLKAGVDHGKARRDLSVVEAYDPSIEGKYVDAVNALVAVDFSILFELKSKNDSSIVDLMDSLCLEGVLAEIPRAEDLQPSPK
ncbi:hypothetical protein Tco_1252078 [Tanacetum coccineum]